MGVMHLLAALMILAGPVELANETLVKASPHKGVKKASSVTRIENEVLGARLPGVQVFTATHKTQYHEYPTVASLVVVKGEKSRHVLEYLFSHDGWPEMLEMFEGTPSASLVDAQELAKAITLVVGSKVNPHEWDHLSLKGDLKPLPEGLRSQVANSEWLVFVLDEKHTLQKVLVERKKESQKK